MKASVLRILCLSVALLSNAAVRGQAQSSGSSPQDKLAALKDLRDSGIITEKEYQAKVKALRASAPADATVAAPGAKTSWSGTRQTEITDPQYQMTAYTMEIPSDWKFAGTIARDPGCHATGAALKYTILSPDGLTAMSQLPSVTWSWSTSPMMQKIMLQQHCPAIDIQTAASFLINIVVPNLRPNAKIVSVIPPDAAGQAALAAQLEKARQQNAAMARQYNQQPQKLTSDGARVRLQYEREGHPVEEMILAVVDCFESQTPAMYAQPASSRRSCTTRGTLLTRAPRGHLDELLARPEFQNLRKSLIIHHDWDNRVAADAQAAFQKAQAESNRQFQAVMQKGRDDNAALLARGRAAQQQMQDSTNRAMANDRATQNAIDASAHATALHSLDRQDFRDPNTGQTIEASSEYNHQWISSDGGTLIQTNDHTFDPNGQVYPVSQSWTELVPQ
jgi:hypothetical protein